MKVSISFKEKPFPYDHKQYERWCDGDIKTINSMINICGNLCRGGDTYINQTTKNQKQNYPEVRYAVNLVENEGFPKDFIIYENFRLSFQMIDRLIKGTGFQAKGVGLISEIFSPLFLKAFDALCDLNEDIFKINCKGSHVDLCAINRVAREVRFCEIKRYYFGGVTKDKFALHQRLLLGFVRYLVDELGKKAFLGNKYKVETDLIAFVPAEDFSAFVPKSPYIIEFAVNGLTKL